MEARSSLGGAGVPGGAGGAAVGGVAAAGGGAADPIAVEAWPLREEVPPPVQVPIARMHS